MLDLRGKTCLNNCMLCYLKDIPDKIKDVWLFDLSVDEEIVKFIDHVFYERRFNTSILNDEIFYKNTSPYIGVEVLYLKYKGKYVLDTSILEYPDLEDIVMRMNSFGIAPVFTVATLIDYKKWIVLKKNFGNTVGIDLAFSSVSNEERLKNHNAHYLKEDFVKNALLELQESYGVDQSLSNRMLATPFEGSWDGLVKDTHWLLSKNFCINWWRASASNYTKISQQELNHIRKERIILEHQFCVQYGRRFSPQEDLPRIDVDSNVFINRILSIRPEEILVTTRKFRELFEDLIPAKDVIEIENKTFGWDIDNSSAGFIVLPDVNILPTEKYVFPRECAFLGAGRHDMLGNIFPKNVRLV